MSNLSVFNFKSHSVRVIADNPEQPLFVAVDTARVLGYKRPNDAYRKLKGSVKHRTLSTKGGSQKLRVIGEADLYRLIFGSKLQSAEKFSDWVVEEVLPQIRKTGAYAAAEPSARSLPDDWQRQLNTEKIRIACKALSLGTGTYGQTLIGWMQQHFGSRTASKIKAPAEAVLYKLSDLVYRQRIGHLEQVNSMRKEDGKPTFVITPPPYSGMSFTYNAQSALLQKEYPVYLEMMKEAMHPSHPFKSSQTNQAAELKPTTPDFLQAVEVSDKPHANTPEQTQPKHTPPKQTPSTQTHLDGRMVSYIENGTVTHSRHLSHDEMIVSSTNLVTLVKQAALTQEQHLELISHCSAQLQNEGAPSC